MEMECHSWMVLEEIVFLSWYNKTSGRHIKHDTNIYRLNSSEDSWCKHVMSSKSVSGSLAAKESDTLHCNISC